METEEVGNLQKVEVVDDSSEERKLKITVDVDKLKEVK